jgi:purine nucleosidase
LDLTNRVPITSEFVLSLARQRQHPLSDLAGLCYSLVTHQDYFAWDVLTTAYIGQPNMFTLKDWNTEIITTGISQGRTSVTSGGRKVSALHTVDLDRFYSYIFKQWSR